MIKLEKVTTDKGAAVPELKDVVDKSNWKKQDGVEIMCFMGLFVVYLNQFEPKLQTESVTPLAAAYRRSIVGVEPVRGGGRGWVLDASPARAQVLLLRVRRLRVQKAEGRARESADRRREDAAARARQSRPHLVQVARHS